MPISPYLHFDGRCAEAFQFYTETLRGTVAAKMPYGAMAGQGPVPADYAERIMHVSLQVDGTMLMGCDVPPGNYQPAAGFRISLVVKTSAEAERVFAALADGGAIFMPLQKTFFAERFGMVNDRFGMPWMVGCMPAASQ